MIYARGRGRYEMGYTPEVNAMVAWRWRTTYLQPILPVVPLQGRSEILAVEVDSLMTSETLFIAGKYHSVLARHVYADSVIGERLRRVDCDGKRGEVDVAVIKHTVEDE